MSLATYNAIVADVGTLTARPDLTAEIAIAVRKATMKAHLSDEWKRDLVDAYPTLTWSTDYRAQIDTTNNTDYPLFRKMVAVKEHNSTLVGNEIQFTELPVDSIFDDYGIEYINYWYQAGKIINIRASFVPAGVKVSYLKFPDIIPATYDSWIADVFADMITEEACSNIYRHIGKTEEAANLAARWNENLVMLRMTQVSI